MSEIEPVELLRRQYLQVLDPKELTFPESSILRLPDTQQEIYDGLFKEGGVAFDPPIRYQYRVLKKIVHELENAILDPDEDVCPGFCVDFLNQLSGDSRPSERFDAPLLRHWQWRRVSQAYL